METKALEEEDERCSKKDDNTNGTHKRPQIYGAILRQQCIPVDVLRSKQIQVEDGHVHHPHCECRYCNTFLRLCSVSHGKQCFHCVVSEHLLHVV